MDFGKWGQVEGPAEEGVSSKEQLFSKICNLVSRWKFSKSSKTNRSNVGIESQD
jgi:hypothetical protein